MSGQKVGGGGRLGGKMRYLSREGGGIGALGKFQIKGRASGGEQSPPGRNDATSCQRNRGPYSIPVGSEPFGRVLYGTAHGP